MTTFLFSVLNHRKSFKLCNGHLIKTWFALGWLIQDKGTLPGKRTDTHTHTRRYGMMGHFKDRVNLKRQR